MNDFSFLGSGWQFKAAAEQASGHVKLSGFDKDIVEAVRIILHTAKGERIMRPDFGSNLRGFVFSDISLSSLSRMEEDVKNSLILWEPRIRDIEVNAKGTEEKGRVDILISYSIRMTNNRYNMVFPYYLDEGSK